MAHSPRSTSVVQIYVLGGGFGGLNTMFAIASLPWDNGDGNKCMWGCGWAASGDAGPPEGVVCVYAAPVQALRQ